MYLREVGYTKGEGGGGLYQRGRGCVIGFIGNVT